MKTCLEFRDINVRGQQESFRFCGVDFLRITQDSVGEKGQASCFRGEEIGFFALRHGIFRCTKLNSINRRRNLFLRFWTSVTEMPKAAAISRGLKRLRSRMSLTTLASSGSSASEAQTRFR